jgi:hypothetical protein
MFVLKAPDTLFDLGGTPLMPSQVPQVLKERDGFVVPAGLAGSDEGVDPAPRLYLPLGQLIQILGACGRLLSFLLFARPAGALGLPASPFFGSLLSRFQKFGNGARWLGRFMRGVALSGVAKPA